MSKIRYAAVLLIVMVFGISCQNNILSKRDTLTITNLRCEYRTEPLGIDVTQPRLSWVLQSGKRGQTQTAYQVLVASDAGQLKQNQGNLWDSGKVLSDNTTAIVYAGNPLTSETQCFWKVRAWDKDGHLSNWSRPAKWTMGLLADEDWKAQWIGYDIEDKPIPAPEFVYKAHWLWSQANANQKAGLGNVYFRKSVDIPADWIVKKATCYFTGDNFAQVYLNGSIIRSFRDSKRLHKITLADYLRGGRNVLAFRAANEGFQEKPAGFIAAIQIEFENGKTLDITTDSQWLMSTEEHPQWQAVDFDDSGWSRAIDLGAFGMAPWQNTKPIELTLPPARYLRGEFSAQQKKIKHAYLYTTALGIYQLYVNGQRVTDDYLSPGWTDFRKRVYYRTYDVTDKLHSGPNAIGAVIADGWYAGYVGGGPKRNHYGSQLRLLSQLNIEYTDGTRQIVASGQDWKASLGPITQADLLMGESYDATKEMPGWNKSNFDDSNWQSVGIGSDEVHPNVQAAVSQPVTEFETLKPVSVSQPVPGRYIFDMGQNFAGVVRIRIKGKAGQKIQLRHAERIKPDGTLYTTSLRTAAATDTYICKGDREETWQPHFTFHGFQYVELTGIDYQPDLNTLTGLALSSDTPTAGTFECSNPMVNKIQSNSLWTQRANFIDIPTDCPQRDERYGWTGDAQVYVNTACYHNDVQAFFAKWMIDLTDAQRDDGQFPRYAPLRVNPSDGGPAWAEAGVICPWTMYHMYGDTRILQNHYESMREFMDFTKTRCTAELLPPEKFHCFGDWLNINDETPHDVIYMAYFGCCANMMAQIAQALDKPQDAAMYHNLFEQIKASFNKAYVQADGKIKSDTQAAYVLAIAYDLLDADKQTLAAGHLMRRIEECDWHLSTGFVGTKDLMLALAKIGRNDIAYKLLYNDTFPSWGFTIKHGATSIWERWNGWTPETGFGDPGMNSFAHYSFGAVCQWIFENIGGIKSDGPGFKKIIIYPQPDGKMTWAKTSYDSIHGLIVSDWTIQNGRFILNIDIPANTSATVFIPAVNPDNILESSVKIQNTPDIRFLKQQGKFAVYQVQSGHYQFSCDWIL